MSSSPSILLVDDHVENLLALEAVLEPLGVECVRARSGFAALREVLHCDFAAILMDVQMPEMDGLETASLIKRRPRCADIPIIFVTGREREPAMIARAFSLGAVDYVMKPYEPALLRSKIQALLDLHRKDAELRESEERFRAAFEHAPIGIAILDCEGNWVDTNTALSELLGVSPEAMVESPPFDLRHLTSADGNNSELEELLNGTRRSYTIERRLFSPNAATIWAAISVSLVRNGYGDPLHLICQVEDVSERKAAEESMSKRIAYLAYHDELTGLPNRAMFREHLDLALARAERHGTGLAILNLDLNRFKLVNDSLGHAAGDQLLREAGARLRDVVRASDLVARVGGDEFVVLLSDLEISKEQGVVDVVAAGIHESLTHPFVISGAEFYVGTSIGVALYPFDAIGAPQPDTEGLLRKADSAMYEAKQSGVPTVVASRPDAAPLERLELMTRLRRAADEGEFTLRWLPIVDLDTRRVCGAEALIRWYDGERWIMPEEFMSLAEDTGLIDRVGLWVLEEAARQQAAWQEEGLELEVSVNISQRQLWRPGIAEEMIDTLTAAGADPTRLVFELAEPSSSRPTEAPQRALAELREAGVRIAIDDFAHAPLSSLQTMEVDTLKIDPSVIAAGNNPEGELMVRAIIQLAHNLGIWTIAEGIETREQYRMLRRAGCRFGQGFYFSEAVSAGELSRQSRSAREPALPIADA